MCQGLNQTLAIHNAHDSCQHGTSNLVGEKQANKHTIVSSVRPISGNSIIRSEHRLFVGNI